MEPSKKVDTIYTNDLFAAITEADASVPEGCSAPVAVVYE
jgi:hypothetical protein